MSGSQTNDTMPKCGHVTDMREQWLMRADGALAHRLQDREISSHLTENRYRNQQIREDFPLALSEQQFFEHEARLKELARRRQADIDAEIAREMAEINLRKQRRHRPPADVLQQPSSSRAGPMAPLPTLPLPSPSPSQSQPPSQAADELNPEELGLSPSELEEIKRRMVQEERDAQIARELSNEVQDQDILLADMRCAVEAQDGELARLLQEREYKKLQRAKEKAKQKALIKKQQRLAAQQQDREAADIGLPPQPPPQQTTLCDAYSNPRDIIRENKLRLCKSVDSDLNYVEPFEKECIQSKASAIQSLEASKDYYSQQSEAGTSSTNMLHGHSHFFDNDIRMASVQHRQPPPPPVTSKKPRFPDPVSIRPASHYTVDNQPHIPQNIPHSYSENNNLYNTPPDSPQVSRKDREDSSKRLSVVSDITAEGLAKKKSKQEMKKRKGGCKIQ